MGLEQVSYFAEIVGTMLVVLTFFFLILQLRHATHALKLNTGLAVTQDIRSLYNRIADRGDLANVCMKGFDDINELQGVERFRFYALMHDYFHTYENAYLQRSAGALDERYWKSAVNGITVVVVTSGGAEYWRNRSWWYTDEFQSYVDNEVIPAAHEKSYQVAGTEKPA